MNIDTLPWKEGFGGVIKAEFNENEKDYTILQCDDGTFTAYATLPDYGAEVFMLTDMTEACLNSLLTQIDKGRI